MASSGSWKRKAQSASSEALMTMAWSFRPAGSGIRNRFPTYRAAKSFRAPAENRARNAASTSATRPSPMAAINVGSPP